MKRQQVMDAIRALGYDPNRVSGVRMTVDQETGTSTVEVDACEWHEDRDAPILRDEEHATYTDTHRIED